MFVNLLQTGGLILFVFAFFGLCIFVHEFGHLLAALRLGLYVERFSIGFGRKLWGTRYRGVEYVVSALPFGGYVALPQLDPTDGPQTADGQELPPVSPAKRALTALAGPAANVLFGFFLALFIWWLGVYRPAPAESCTVVSVPEHAPEYQAGLRSGDLVVTVNGDTFRRGWDELNQKITLSSGEVTLGVRRNGETLQVQYRPAPNPEYEGLGYPFFTVRVPVVVRGVMSGSPAAAAGLQAHDRIVAVDGKILLDMDDFVETVRGSAGRPMDVVVERDGSEVQIRGMQAQLQHVDGRPVYQIGVRYGAFVLMHPNPWEQFVQVFTRTRDTLRPMLKKDSLVRPRHMSGPLGILQMLWYHLVLYGWRGGLSFVILLSFSLAFFNLLPIPVLDGGHILFAAVELAIRRRIPMRIAYGLQTVFAVLIVALMLYITFFDVRRLPRFLRLFRGEAETETTESVPERTAPPPAAETVPAPGP